MISTMIPEIWLVLVSRKVKGTPVGVEPTRTTCWAPLTPINPIPRATATRARQNNVAIMARTLLEEKVHVKICSDAEKQSVRTVAGRADHIKRICRCQTQRRAAILIHGSVASGADMHEIARALTIADVDA